MSLLKALFIACFISFFAVACGNLKNMDISETSEQTGVQDSVIIVSIDSGGSVEIPEGAIPDWDHVSVESIAPPDLTYNLQPIGNAYLIESTSGLSKPLILRLPIPDGVQDLYSIKLVCVKVDGTLSTLVTHLDGNEIVASISELSTFVLAEQGIIEGKYKDRYINVNGRAALYPGEISSYSVRLENPFSGLSNQKQKVQDIEWTVSGPFQVVQTRGLSVIIKVDSKVKSYSGDIGVSFFEPVSGYLYSGIRKIRVQKY